MLQTSLRVILLVATGAHVVDAAQARDGAKFSFVRLRTETLEVISDEGEPAARRALARMQQMERLLGRRQSQIRAYLFRDDRWFRDLRPVPTARGFFQSGPERDFVAVVDGPDHLRALSHEFVHASLEHSTARRPLWLEEGVAEFYSTVSPEKDRWFIGRPIDDHVRVLRRADWLPARQLFNIGKESSVYDEANRAGLFYAQSWAVVHLLYTQPGYREHIQQFAELLDEGVPAEEACLRAFRRSATQVLDDARQRILRDALPVAAVAADPLDAPRVQVDTVNEEIVAELALACGKTALAARIYEGRNSATPLGLLALARGDNAQALKYFNQAIAEGAPDSTPYFEAAMLLRDAKQPFEPLLRQAVERNPRHAEAWFLLGLEAAKRDQLEDAIEAYQKATAILPRQANFWHAIAMALHRAGRREEAARAAQKCRLAATTTAEREMAAALNGFVSSRASAPAPKQPAVVIPDAWQGLQGDAISDGVLEELVCGDPAVMRIKGVGELRVLRPREIRITGGSRALACGPADRKVRVGYIQATRELVSVEFVP
jgi:tetratricopeptide (TPR) repeat protein